ncbi:MAG: alpha-E domain-containing protein [Verrucomicrobiales bacterium]
MATLPEPQELPAAVDPAPAAVASSYPTTIMLSRVAAALYWMGRYLERAENLARLVDVNIQLLIDFGSIDDQRVKEHWIPVLRTAGDEELFFQHYPKADSASVTEFMTFHRDNPNSVFSCVCAARENARQVRDQISLEMWEVLNEVYLFLQSRDAQQVWRDGPGAFYDQIKRFSHLFQGLTDATFSRTEGWEFIQFGKYLERADKTTRILDVKYHILLPRATDVGGAVDTAQWQTVLRSTSALEAYRRFYVTEILPLKVAEFLVLSDSFPRSLRYCLAELEHSLGRIGGPRRLALPPSEAELDFQRLRNDLDTLSMKEIVASGLHEFLHDAQAIVGRLATHIYDTFMHHPPVDLAAEIRFHQQEQQQQQQQSEPQSVR